MWFWEGGYKYNFAGGGFEDLQRVENVSEKGGLTISWCEEKRERGGEYDLQGNYGFRFPTRIF